MLKKCFPNASIESSEATPRPDKLAAWHDYREILTVRGQGLEDAAAVVETVRAAFKDAINAAVGPTKMASGKSGTYKSGNLSAYWIARGYVFEAPNRCVGNVSAYCIPADGGWLFVFEAVEVPQ